MSARAAFDPVLAREIIDRKRSLPGAALPILHDLQHQFGYVDDAAIPLMADALNISRAEALGVVSFYHDFRRAPVDGRVLKLCRAESCQAMGCEALVDYLDTRHGLSADDAEGGGALPRRNRLLSRKLRPLARGAFRRRADRQARPRSDRRDCRRRRGQSAVSARIFVPADSSALSVGADAVASALASEARRRGIDLRIVRTGSRGLFWLEPLVEVETPEGRMGYGPVAPPDAASLFESGFLDRRGARNRAGPGRGHPLSRPTAAPRLRPLRRDRPALARRLSSPWRP